MARNVVQKILSDHLVAGELTPGSEIGLRIDQTLTQDATGTTAFLLLEAMGVSRVRTELSVSYVDHNLAQFGPENANDHAYLQSIAAKVGAYFSRPGNGICHQVHLERFARPGMTLLGSDSHTPTAGGMGCLGIGAGGLEVAVAMGGRGGRGTRRRGRWKWAAMAVRKGWPVVRERQVRQWRPERQEKVSKNDTAVAGKAGADSVGGAALTGWPPRSLSRR